ncbi:DUF7686 domain-containing protein [Planococcus sp. CAU13]|uniref:DUF7686 domain-containing protein n=1 Tax=Planococcus sp. CAU13 TaxID=1541197 RepID=UPI00068DE94B|nr:hypothetical protein [Planococcus sp. CAU13]
MTKCKECQQDDVYIHFGEEKLCLACYNVRMEKQFGVAATSYPEGVVIRDGKGEVRHFLLRKRMDLLGIFMEAKEMTEGGYEFNIQDDLYSDQGELLLRLIAKAERGMAEIYVERRTFPNGQNYNSIRNDRLAGRIDSNLTDERLPLLAINGKAYTWEEVGRMLMGYKRFQVKLEMLDSYEEIVWEENEVHHFWNQEEEKV